MPKCLSILHRKLGVLDAFSLSWRIICLVNRLISNLLVLCPTRIFLGHFRAFFFHSGAFKRNKSDLCVSGAFKTRMFSMAQFPASRDTRNFVFLHLKTISMHLLGCT